MSTLITCYGPVTAKWGKRRRGECRGKPATKREKAQGQAPGPGSEAGEQVRGQRRHEGGAFSGAGVR